MPNMIPTMKLRVVVFVLSLLGTAPALASNVSPNGADLIQQASAKTNIFELSNFELQARVRLENFGKPLEGTYSLFWNGPEQWREEISFPGYSEVQVGGKGVIYLKRSAPYIPYQIFKMRAALGFETRVNPGPHGREVIKRVHEEKVAGTKAKCVEIATEEKNTREVCVDPATGLFNRSKDGIRESDVLPIGAKLFPQSILLVEKGKPEVDLHITVLRTVEPFASTVFDPPSGSISRAGCMNPVPARRVKSTTANYFDESTFPVPQGTVAGEPKLPVERGIANPTGRVGVYALIDENGIPRNVHVTLNADSGLDSASVDAIRTWRYEPATCNGTPVAVETSMVLNYDSP